MSKRNSSAKPKLGTQAGNPSSELKHASQAGAGCLAGAAWHMHLGGCNLEDVAWNVQLAAYSLLR